MANTPDRRLTHVASTVIGALATRAVRRDGGHQTPSTPRSTSHRASHLSLSPLPPVAGQPVEICHDFGGSGITETMLDVSFTPDAPNQSYDVSTAIPCVTITVPDGATQILVHDQCGKSPDNGSMIQGGS
jgi:hypothetical protein